MNYERMTATDFDACLRQVVPRTVNEWMAIPGIYELVSAYFTNETFDAWEHAQRAKAAEAGLTLCEECGAFIDPALGDEDPFDPNILHLERDGSLDEPRAPSNDDNDYCTGCMPVSEDL